VVNSVAGKCLVTRFFSGAHQVVRANPSAVLSSSRPHCDEYPKNLLCYSHLGQAEHLQGYCGPGHSSPDHNTYVLQENGEGKQIQADVTR